MILAVMTRYERKETHMKKPLNHDLDCEFFSAKRFEDVIVLRLKENLLLQATDLGARDTVLNYLDLISETLSIKVVLIISDSMKKGCDEYFDFFNRALKHWDLMDVHRIHNVFTQIILKIVELKKIVVHANRGCVISLFLNLSLACDYRIVADDTVFQNPFLKLGLVPMGGGAFFLSRMIGAGKAYRILLSGNDITAHEAMTLGVVDEVVDSEKLEAAALAAARRFAQNPARSLAGVKRLINYSMKDLREFMEIEHQELMKIVESHDYMDSSTKTS